MAFSKYTRRLGQEMNSYQLGHAWWFGASPALHQGPSLLFQSLLPIRRIAENILATGWDLALEDIEMEYPNLVGE